MHLSKRAAKRKLTKEVWALRKQKNKREKTGDGGVETSCVGEDGGLSKRKQLANQEFLQKLKGAPTVVVDFDFEDVLTRREKNSMAQQIMHLYGANRRATQPLNLHLASLRGETEEMLSKMAGFPNSWREKGVKIGSDAYTEEYPTESLVYLTADSTTVLSALRDDRVYVLGGIVDRNRLKNITMEKARQQGIATARFPIGEYCDLTGSEVLTINQCFEILLARHATADWSEAFLRGIPSRKDLLVKSQYRSTAQSTAADASNDKMADAKPNSTSTSTAHELRRPAPLAKTGWHAIVIGASRGIGLGFSKVLRQRGYDVLMVSRHPSDLATAVTEVEKVASERGSPAVFSFAVDCTEKSKVFLLRDYVNTVFGPGRGAISVLVNSAGSFQWDKDITGDLDATKVLTAANLYTKQHTFQMMIPFLLTPNYAPLPSVSKEETPLVKRETFPRIVLVGSQAGKPGFKEEIESREGPGAVDGEQGYINAMVALRKWALGMKSVFAKKGIVVELVEPGLIDTAMARREFSHFPIVWDDIIKPEAYARSVFGYEHAADVEK